MSIAVLTYRTPHLKTEQVVLRLVERGESIALYALPFAPRPGRPVAFAHRPEMADGADPEELATTLSLPFTPIEGPEDITGDFDAVVVAGAGLLPASFVERYRVVNCHPGLQPAVRGLDAFKWAIHDGMPLGVSLHLVDVEVDAGKHLASRRTPVLPSDTVDSLARRHYEREIALLTDFRRYLDAPESHLPGLAVRPARKRMPVEAERSMLANFDAWKAQQIGRKATP